MRPAAKAAHKGLLTINIEFPNGERLEEQGVFGPAELMFAKWAMAMLFCDEVRELPDLEATVRGLMARDRRFASLASQDE